MSSISKRGLIALAIGVTAALAVAIPTVIAASTASGPATTANAEAAQSPAATVVGSCNTSKVVYASDTTFESTLSTSFIPVTGMSVNFTTTRHCAEVTFSNTAAAEGDDLMYVRVLVDGTVCMPGAVQWQQKDNVSPTNYLHATSYTFVCNFAFGNHGNHNAVVQYRSLTGVGGAYSAQPMMVVRYS